MVAESIYSMDPTAAISSFLGISQTLAVIIMVIIGLWTIIWKGLALWKSCKKNQTIWFVILLVVNTIGILEILYIYVFSKMNFENKKQVKIKKAKK